MSQGSGKEMTNEQVRNFTALLGAPPVLSSEDATHYDKIGENLLECFMPRDFMEVMLIRQVQDETWKYLRYTRHQTIGIERRFRKLIKSQSERVAQKPWREAFAQNQTKETEKPAGELSRLNSLEDIVNSSVSDVDNICQRAETELEHNRALEAGLLFEEQFDKLISSAGARRNNGLQQLELYREGLGQYWRKITDKIIEVESAEIGEPRQIEAPLQARSSGSQPAGGAFVETATSGHQPAEECMPPNGVTPVEKGETSDRVGE